VPGVSGAWVEARRLPDGAGALHGQWPQPCHVEAALPRLRRQRQGV